MRVEPMHDRNQEFRLIGYRVIAENRDEERIINLSQWKASVAQFSQEAEIHLRIVMEIDPPTGFLGSRPVNARTDG